VTFRATILILAALALPFDPLAAIITPLLTQRVGLKAAKMYADKCVYLSSRRRRQVAVESRSILHTPRKPVQNAVTWKRRTAKGMCFNNQRAKLRRAKKQNPPR
jgi:hypothetical protein